MLLTDARQRAERILQDSMERATDLLNRDRATPAGAASAIEVETIRRSVDELVVGMRDVQSRLARIESIISSQRTSAPMAPAQPAPPSPPPAPPMQSAPPAPPAAPAAPSTPPVPPQRPAFSRPADEDRRPGGLSVVPERPRPASPPPPSVVPPLRGQPAAAHAPFRAEPDVVEAEPVREPERSAPTSMGGGVLAGASIGSAAADLWERDDTDDVAGTLATFTPADGSVQLRAAPVSGFQGLMRLQDALQRIPAVRQATVEAYSQGEARLRLELVADVDSDEIAEGLGAGLGQNAIVQEASEAERSITIAFG